MLRELMRGILMEILSNPNFPEGRYRTSISMFITRNIN